LPVRPVNLAGEGCNEDDLVDMVKLPARVVRDPQEITHGILLFVLLVVLVATLGFWDTVSALLGAVSSCSSWSWVSPRGRERIRLAESEASVTRHTIPSHTMTAA
jgi:hypothetical protein